MNRAARIAVIIVVLLIVAVGALYAYIISGGLIARQQPPAIEKNVTRFMLEASVPDSAKTMKNPLMADNGGGGVFSGQELYKQKSGFCYGLERGRKTERGWGT